MHIPAWLLWIEMKALDGSISPDQKEVANYLESVGHTVIFAWGKDDAIKQTTDFIEARNARERIAKLASGEM